MEDSQPLGYPQCTSKSKRSGKRCTKRVAPGARLCHMHFGNTPKEKRLTLIRQEKMRLSEAITKMPISDETPSEALLRMVQTASRAEQALSSFIAGNASDEILEDVRMEAYVTLWNQERDRLTKTADIALRAGISEKLVELAKQDGRQVVELLLSVLSAPELDLPKPTVVKARKLLADKIRHEQLA